MMYCMINSSAYFLLLFSEAQIALNYIGYIIVVYCSICRLYHDRGESASYFCFVELTESEGEK